MTDSVPSAATREFAASEDSHARIRRLREVLRERQPGPDLGIPERRALFEEMAARIPVLEGLRIEGVVLGRSPAQRLRPPGPARPGTVLYLHGGGYVLGSATASRAMAARIAAATGCVVFSLDYRLAPEHPYPAALDDAVRAYHHLMELPAGGPVVLCGDSAGAGLAVATARRVVRAGGHPAPAAIVCLSPWSDLTLSGASVHGNAELDPQVPGWLLSAMADDYAAGHDPQHPELSPAYADLAGLPPILVQVSSAEVLYDDGLKLAAAARRAGVDVTVEIWHDMPHVWHAFAPGLPEAIAAIGRLGEWTRRRLDARPVAAAGART